MTFDAICPDPNCRKVLTVEIPPELEGLVASTPEGSSCAVTCPPCGKTYDVLIPKGKPDSQ